MLLCSIDSVTPRTQTTYISRRFADRARFMRFYGSRISHRQGRDAMRVHQPLFPHPTQTTTVMQPTVSNEAVLQAVDPAMGHRCGEAGESSNLEDEDPARRLASSSALSRATLALERCYAGLPGVGRRGCDWRSKAGVGWIWSWRRRNA